MPEPIPAEEPPKTLAEALVTLQAQLPRVAKDQEGQVGTRTIKYADLTMISEALFPLLTGMGMAFVARPTLDDQGRFGLSYALVSRGGEELGGFYPLPSSGGPQALGAAITYARRYALCAITGLAPAEDDDPDAGDGQERPARQRRARNVPDAQLAADGRMTRAQKADHEHLAADTQRGGKAERSHPRGPDPDDPWAQDQPVDQQRAAQIRGEAEDQPGSSNPGQHQQLGILYGQLGITERAARLAEMTARTGRVIASAKDLSYAEAEQAIRALRQLAAKEGANS